jgi:hypothetical protein
MYMSGEPFSAYSGARINNNSHTSRADIVGAKPTVDYHGATAAPPTTQSIIQTGESARVIQLG